jgi:hypothetical protein
MSDLVLTQLKIIVERAVRPVLASTSCKWKMREELLAHVSDAFEEESARLGDDRAALERTALRFGNPAEVTGQLQESVPASDGVVAAAQVERDRRHRVGTRYVDGVVGEPGAEAEQGREEQREGEVSTP